MIIQIIRRLAKVALINIIEKTDEKILAGLNLALKSNSYRFIPLEMMIVGNYDKMK
jgi:hypothetical protein